MALLTKAAILATELRSKVIPVPEWGGDVRIVELAADEREAIETAIIEARNEGRTMGDVRARYVAACVVDDKGKRVFDMGDVAKLAKKSGAALSRIHSEIVAFNLLEPEAIEGAAKN